MPNDRTADERRTDAFACVFCNLSIERSLTDPTALLIKSNWVEDSDWRRSGQYWCHYECLRAAAHPAIPFYNSDLTDLELARWDRVKGAFQPDGGLLSITVSGTALADWDRLLGAVRVGGWDPVAQLADGALVGIPGSARQVFQDNMDIRPTLLFRLGSLEIHCGFSATDVIELRFDARLVRSAGLLDKVERFLAWIGRLLMRQATLTSPNRPGEAILTYDPRTDRVTISGTK